jgi:DNA-binding MarR family transcriptional regulator
LASRWVERLLAGHEPPLTLPQYLALQAIDEGKVVGADLALRAAVSQAAVSQLLAALETLGFVERSRTADDRRRYSLALTPAGARALHSAQELLRNRLGLLLADLPPPETDALDHLLRRVEAALSGTAPPPRRQPEPLVSE